MLSITGFKGSYSRQTGGTPNQCYGLDDSDPTKNLDATPDVLQYFMYASEGCKGSVVYQGTAQQHTFEPPIKFKSVFLRC
ncbi:uncharacterized protein VTP21DRAFT_10869 [Calcarisporiella thermophila]|uniref:uncharacterized protein n=1 Tax=Calcarisporiella thermophila TaxID=911321 RepID=UPI003744649F